MFFSCKVCAEKDKRIEELNAQLQYVKDLVFNPNTGKAIPYINMEANKIMDGSTDPIDATVSNSQQDWLKEQERIQAEAMNILNGNY